MTDNACERALRPAVIQRKVTKGFRAKWAADLDAAFRTTVDTARLNGINPYTAIHQTIVASPSTAKGVCNYRFCVCELVPISTGLPGLTRGFRDSLKSVLMSDIEIMTDGGRRRRWPAAEKLRSRH